MKTLTMKFLTDAGKSFSVNLNYAAPELWEEDGPDAIKTAVDYILDNQPFEADLVSVDSVTLTDKETEEVVLPD